MGSAMDTMEQAALGKAHTVIEIGSQIEITVMQIETEIGGSNNSSSSSSRHQIGNETRLSRSW